VPTLAGTTREITWELISTVGPSPIAKGVTHNTWTGNAGFLPPRFGERAEFVAGGTMVYLCQTGSGRCYAYNRKTRTTHTFTVNLPTRPVTDADWQFARESFLARAPSAAIRAHVTEAFDGLPRTKTFGRFAMARADGAGRLWLRTYERYRQPTDLWLVLSPTGAAVATVVTPSGLTPLSFAGPELLGETLDEDAVPVVRRYRAILP
jgi:hypothetical protein